MREHDISGSRPLIPILSPDTVNKLVVRLFLEQDPATRYSELGRNRMKQQGQSALISLLETGGGQFQFGGALGYHVLWTESIKGPIKLPVVSQEAIEERVEEVAMRMDESLVGEDMDEDPVYLRCLVQLLSTRPEAEMIMTLDGAVTIRDLLRAQAERDQFHRLIDN